MSSGVTAALVGGGGDVEDTAAPGAAPSIWQDTRTHPADPLPEPTPTPTPDPTSDPAPVPSSTARDFAMGEKAKSGGATVVVEKVTEAATVAIDNFGSDRILKAGTGAKYAIVETSVQNDGTDSFDPVCGGGISQGLVDAEGRKFDVIQETFLVKANQKVGACGEEVQPGFDRDAVFVYKIPADATPAAWAFSGSRGMTEGDETLVRLTATSASG